MRRETCAGGVVYRRAGGRFEIAVAEERDRLTGAPNTRLAKGHVEAGESLAEAALREVREEIGVAARIVAELGSVHYTYVERGVTVEKDVHFFLMEALPERPGPLDGEMLRRVWCDVDEVPSRLTFDSERGIAEAARRVIERRSG